MLFSSSKKYSPCIDYKVYGIDDLGANKQEAETYFYFNGGKNYFIGHHAFDDFFPSCPMIQIDYSTMLSVHIPGEEHLLTGEVLEEDGMILVPYVASKLDFSQSIEVLNEKEVVVVHPYFSLSVVETNRLLKVMGSWLRINEGEMVLFAKELSRRQHQVPPSCEDVKLNFEMLGLKNTISEMVVSTSYESDAQVLYEMGHSLGFVTPMIGSVIDASLDEEQGNIGVFLDQIVSWRRLGHSTSRPNYQLLQPINVTKLAYQWVAIHPAMIIGDVVTLSYGSSCCEFVVRKTVEYINRKKSLFPDLELCDIEYKALYGYVSDSLYEVPDTYIYSKFPFIVHSNYGYGCRVQAVSAPPIMECRELFGFVDRENRKMLPHIFDQQQFNYKSVKRVVDAGARCAFGSDSPVILKISPIREGEFVLSYEKSERFASYFYSIVCGTVRHKISPFYKKSNKYYRYSDYQYLTRVARSIRMFKGEKMFPLSDAVTSFEFDVNHKLLVQYGVQGYYRIAMLSFFSRNKDCHEEVTEQPSHYGLTEDELKDYEWGKCISPSIISQAQYEAYYMVTKYGPKIVAALGSVERWHLHTLVGKDDIMRWLVRLSYKVLRIKGVNMFENGSYSAVDIEKAVDKILGWEIPCFLDDEEDTRIMPEEPLGPGRVIEWEPHMSYSSDEEELYEIDSDYDEDRERYEEEAKENAEEVSLEDEDDLWA